MVSVTSGARLRERAAPFLSPVCTRFAPLADFSHAVFFTKSFVHTPTASDSTVEPPINKHPWAQIQMSASEICPLIQYLYVAHGTSVCFGEVSTYERCPLVKILKVITCGRNNHNSQKMFDKYLCHYYYN